MNKEKFLEEIAKVAYEMFEKRGRNDGHAMDDWLEAERIVLNRHASEISREAEAIRNRAQTGKAVKAPPAPKKSTVARKSVGEGATTEKKTVKKSAPKAAAKKK